MAVEMDKTPDTADFESLREPTGGSVSKPLREALGTSFLKKLESLSVVLRRPASGATGGIRKSKRTGASVEFSDFREYSPGDDFRRIDWNTYARFDKLFLKLFMEEQQTRITLLLDNTASMDWGKPNKLFFGKQLCAVLCYLALLRYDSVNIWPLGSRGGPMPVVSGRMGFLKLMDFLDKLPVGGESNISAAIKSARVPSAAGICVLISDLFSGDGIEDGINYLMYRRQEVTVLSTMSPEELVPPYNGRVRLLDREGGPHRDIHITPNILMQYQKTLEKFQNDNISFCHARGIPYLSLRTDMPLEQVVIRDLQRCGLIR